MIPSVLPPSRPATTLPAPPPPDLASLRAAARERLDADPPAKPAPEPGRDTVPCPPPSDEQPVESLGLLSSWGSNERWRSPRGAR